MLSEVSGHESRGFWSDAFRFCGYVPFFSSFTGPARAVIGTIGTVVNAIALPLVYATGDNELFKETKEKLEVSTGWIVRGVLESKPGISNGVVWSIDSLFDRIRGRGYQTGFLYDARFTPLFSVLTGAIRTGRGLCGVIVGVAAQALLSIKEIFSKTPAEIQQDKLASHKFTIESLYEIPQGILEMVPAASYLCPALEKVENIIERKKIALWQSVRSE